MRKVSIIIPVYNAEKTIEKCVSSILKQTYKNYEVLLIDDGSSDNSLDVIQKYKKHENIKVLTQENHGVAYTRNRGIKEATGDYIMFIDNDDFIDSDYIEKHITAISKENSDIVMSGYRRINVENKVLHEEKLRDTYWSRFIVTAPWAKVYRRDFLLKNNIEFLSYGIGEDVYFNLLIYSFDPKITILNYIGYNWFFNTKSVSNTSQKGLNKNVDILFLLNKIIEKYDSIDGYLSYYLIRYYIWYLLFSGRNANKKDFILEYNRIKMWYNDNKISLKFSPFSKKIDGETLKNRIIVFVFLALEKMHLIGLFAKFYCKG